MAELDQRVLVVGFGFGDRVGCVEVVGVDVGVVDGCVCELLGEGSVQVVCVGVVDRLVVELDGEVDVERLVVVGAQVG